MILIHCNVRIKSARQSSAGFSQRPGTHQRDSEHHSRRNRIRRNTGQAETVPGSPVGSRLVYGTSGPATEGVRPPGTNHQATERDHRSTDEGVPAPTVRSYRDGATNTDSDKWTGRSKEETRSCRDRRGATGGIGNNDTGCTTIWRGSPRFEDAVSQRPYPGSQSSSSCSPGPGGQRPQISRLPRLFRVRSNSVERMDCSTPDGYTTQARQLSWRTVEDAVRIQPPERSSLSPDLTTSPGGWNDRAGRPTSFYSTPGSSFWGPDWVATTKWIFREIKQTNHEFSQYNAEFQVIATDLDLNPSTLRNALRMGLSKELKGLFTYSDMPEELPAFVTVCQKQDKQIRQRWAEKAAQNTGGGISFPSPRPPPSPKAPEMAPAGTVAGYTRPAPMDLSAGRRTISVEERAKRFSDRRCLYCGGFNHRAAECAARKHTPTFKAAGAEVIEWETKECSKKSGQD